MPRPRTRKAMPKVGSKNVAEVIDVGSFEPETPVKTGEGLDHRSNVTPLSSCHLPGSEDTSINESRSVRRSTRLASKNNMDLDVATVGVKVTCLKRKCFSTDDKEYCINFDMRLTARNECSDGGKVNLIVETEKDVVTSQVHGKDGCMRNLSGVEERFTEEKLELNICASSTDSEEIGPSEEKVLNIKKGKRKMDPCTKVKFVEVEQSVNSATEKKHLTLRSGKRIEIASVKRKSDQSSINDEHNHENICANRNGNVSNGWTCSAVTEDANLKQIEDGSFERSEKYNVDDNGKMDDAKNVSHNSALTFSQSDHEAERTAGITHSVGNQISAMSTKKIDKGKEKLIIDEKSVDTKAGFMVSTSTIPGNNKGKGKLSIDDITSKSISMPGYRSEEKVESRTRSTVTISPIVSGNEFQDSGNPKQIIGSSTSLNRGFRDRFRDIAKRNASRFAHFPSLEEEDNRTVDDLESDPPEVVNQETEDWPGPFSTAKRIIKDRQTKASMQQSPTLLKSESTPIVWKPKQNLKSNIKKISVPSLVDMCLYSIAENADAITSLDCVPDILLHKLSDMLCDSRKIDEHFLALLANGSPTEIHVRECSWITEEIFTKNFSGRDMSNLTVLQLDQCGGSMPDYILSSTFAHSPNCLPSLTSLSVMGAYRLSDTGLSLLTASAPALRSINLSQCSLLTSDAIHRLASSVGTVLMALYIDDCQWIDAMIILPALLQFQKLEVLSLTNIASVSDKFINRFAPIGGHIMKELVLRNCINLTDSSMRTIAEYCPKLCAIDLSNLSKLTDLALEYLANSCLIHTLKLCRNGFSDEAVAAYLETRGESLTELSLSNVNMVAHNTAVSLARHSKNLHTLDLSWCRKLTDEAFGLIVDSCTSLKMLKVFGCTQITNAFLDGHSNQEVEMIGLKMTPILRNLNLPEYLKGPLRHSFVTS